MKLTTALIAMLAALPLHAEPAVYQDEVLTLAEVLVQGSHGPALYGNVQLERNQDGTFSIIGREVLPIADVQSISVEKDQYPPGTVVVVVQGFKSMPCIDVAEATVSRVGNTFHFAFRELPPPDNVRCITRVEPMMEAFGIQTTDLEPGEYEIVYGEMHVAFTLHPAP